MWRYVPVLFYPLTTFVWVLLSGAETNSSMNSSSASLPQVLFITFPSFPWKFDRLVDNTNFMLWDARQGFPNFSCQLIFLMFFCSLIVCFHSYDFFSRIAYFWHWSYLVILFYFYLSHRIPSISSYCLYFPAYCEDFYEESPCFLSCSECCLKILAFSIYSSLTLIW